MVMLFISVLGLGGMLLVVRSWAEESWKEFTNPLGKLNDYSQTHTNWSYYGYQS
jgi:hypothetical protein